MGKTLQEVADQKVHVVEVVHHGDKMVLPDGMTAGTAIETLQRLLVYENETTQIVSMFDCLPWDGAYALFNVLKRKYGWASMETVYSFFGDTPPKLIDIEVGYMQMEAVPWGRLSLFKKEGYIDTGVAKVNGRYMFQATASVLRKHEKIVRDIYQEVRVELKTKSIYRGKAVSIRFRNDDGSVREMPDSRFVDTRGALKENLIYSADVQAIIDTNLFTPIERMNDCKAAGLPVKRGILLAGVFGTGKTLAARVASALAVENHITFIYCKRAEEFAEAVQFSLQYSPAVVFCEDIDRVLAGERSVEMDDILNIIDGIDTKSAEVIVVLTTNAPEKLNPASLRPGRLDAVIEVKKPDAGAVVKLIKLYGRGFLNPNADLQKVGETLAGNIPAVIEEVVKRSKLAALKMIPKGTAIFLVGEDAIAEAAATMQMQLQLLHPQVTTKDDSSLEGILTPILAPIVKDAIAEWQAEN